MRFKNWKKVQFLHDAEWHDLDSKSGKSLIMLWLMARENDGELPNLKQISFLLRFSIPQTEKILNKLSYWLVFDHLENENKNEHEHEHEVCFYNVCENKNNLSETEVSTNFNNTGISKNPSSTKALKPDDVPDLVWNDFLNLRKARRSPLTFTALRRIENEAKKANMPLTEVLTICCERGWQGFCADWLITQPIANKRDQILQANRSIAANWVNK